MSSAQRLKLLRERALTALAQGQDLAPLPDTGLLAALQVAYRQGQAAMVQSITEELLHRLHQQGPRRG